MIFSYLFANLLVYSDNSRQYITEGTEDNEINEKGYPFYRSHSFKEETHMEEINSIPSRGNLLEVLLAFVDNITLLP